jgi:hypothetical protein
VRDWLDYAAIAAGLFASAWSLFEWRRRRGRIPRYVHVIALLALASGIAMYLYQPTHPWDGKQVITPAFVLLLPVAAYLGFGWVTFGWLVALLRLTRADQAFAFAYTRRPRLVLSGVWLLFVGVVALWPKMGIAWAVAIGIPLVAARRFWRRWSFVRRHRGRWLVVGTRRRGWRDFLVNNVAPALAHVDLVWADAGHTPEVVRLLRAYRFHPRRPYLVVVGDWRLDVYSLHDRLLPLKCDAKRSAVTQRAVANLIEAAVGVEFREPSS